MEENFESKTECRPTQETSRICGQTLSEDILSNEPTNDNSSNKIENPVNTQTNNLEKENTILSYTFNGHSNLEIILFFTLAFITSILFYFKQSAFINHVGYFI